MIFLIVAIVVISVGAIVIGCVPHIKTLFGLGNKKEKLRSGFILLIGLAYLIMGIIEIS